ncbi:K02A2.6-like [Cordylochernes scorpioides]|uniref:K02A2.6-like n=1 Tax=Cordylochernes scorpioides TaxID=51811 RepID=A0ABY6K4X9_9ARAC|nr:K02A2.6-like [Cordylochernes scorpioides]
MLENGITEQPFSPFSSPVTLVTKRDKTKSFCIDYRKVNELISSDVHPLPRIEDILDRLARAKYFSTADISSAYWQVPIHPDSRPLLAFATLEGLYQPTRLPFGLKTSPQIYERAMSQVLRRHGLDCVAHYFDDFIIFSDTLEEHQNHLRHFFAFCESINFLGYTITAGTTTPLTRNTDIIHAIQQPHNRKTLQSFLGAVNVYNNFIPEYARLRTPLNNLLKKDVMNGGATRVTSARVDRRILRQAVAAPQATCTAILQHVQDTLDHSISTRTISRRLSTMTAQRYVDDVLRPVTLPYLQGVPNALYQQDNARPHTARISQQALQDVQMLPWPPYSPDLSPIEHVWDIIGRRLHALPQPRSEDELWQMVEREWRAIPQDAIRTLIDSLPRRVAACIAVRGGPTCY